MNLPRDVTETVAPLLARLPAVLGDNLVGLYLRGSLAMGDFLPASSDLDLLAVTEKPITPDEFSALVALHAELAALPTTYATRLEIAYIDRQALARFVPGRQHPTLGQGETLAWTEHRDHWILERWTVREHGVALLGPDPRILIEPITPDELRAAARARLRDWADWGSNPDDPEFLLPRSHQAYVVETMCRALYTLTHGALSTKRQAVTWAVGALPRPWNTLAARSQTWRTDPRSDRRSVPTVLRFVQWAALYDETVEGARSS